MVLSSPVIGRLYEPLGAHILAASGMTLLIAGYIDMPHFTLGVSTLRMLPASILPGAGVACLHSVMPGMVATDGTRANSDEAAFNRVMQNQAIKKRVEPEHLAGLIAFVASDDAAMITGQTIICDGGGYWH